MSLQEIPLTRLVESPFNPRKTFPAAAIAELAADLKVHGQLQPILVRVEPVSGVLVGFEIPAVRARHRFRFDFGFAFTTVDPPMRPSCSRTVCVEGAGASVTSSPGYSGRFPWNASSTVRS